MAYWLMKSEPDVLGYTDLENKPVEQWHGVRNYTARNNMKAMKLGELAFFYHSNIGKEIVGIMKVVALAHPDSTAEPNDKGKVVWECVDVRPSQRLPKPVTLETIKKTPELADMALVKLQPPLGAVRVTDAEWKLICKMGGLKKSSLTEPLNGAIVPGADPAERGTLRGFRSSQLARRRPGGGREHGARLRLVHGARQAVDGGARQDARTDQHGHRRRRRFIICASSCSW